MSGSINKVILVGRLGKDPEMAYTPSGKPVTKFSLATSRFSNSDGERQEFTDWHNIVAWNIGTRALAEHVAKYTHKGDLVYVEGQLRTRSWEGQDGTKRWTTEVIAYDVQFLQTKGENGQKQQQSSSSGYDVDPDEIPF